MTYKKQSRKEYAMRRKISLQKIKRTMPNPHSNRKMFVSAFVFDAPELTLAEVEVLKIKRKYAVIKYGDREYEIPKDWLAESLGKK